MRDTQSNTIEEPVVLKSKIDWVNQTNKIVPESNESIATVSHKFLAKIAANRKWTLLIENYHIWKSANPTKKPIIFFLI
jgi:hypothetical protein